MATKAELEAELSELRRQLAERDSAKNDGADDTGATQPTGPDDAEDWDNIVSEIAKEFEALPLKRPLLIAAGIFAFGWMIGRSSR